VPLPALDLDRLLAEEAWDRLIAEVDARRGARSQSDDTLQLRHVAVAKRRVLGVLPVLAAQAAEKLVAQQVTSAIENVVLCPHDGHCQVCVPGGSTIIFGGSCSGLRQGGGRGG